MKLAALTSAYSKKLAKLVEQRESLLAELSLINRALTARGSSEPAGVAVARRVSKAAAKPVAKASTKARAPGKRGHLKEAIVQLLRSSGKEGQSVKEIAAKLKAKPQNIYMWFSVTGKTINGIKKVGPARYVWKR